MNNASKGRCVTITPRGIRLAGLIRLICAKAQSRINSFGGRLPVMDSARECLTNVFHNKIKRASPYRSSS